MPIPIEAHKSIEALQAYAASQCRGPFFELSDSDLVNGWEMVGDHDRIFKLNAKNPKLGLFVKCFSPKAEPYAVASGKVLQTLSEIDLPIRVLAPVAILPGVHLFPLGVPRPRIPALTVMSRADLARIDEVVRAAGLRPLFDPGILERYLKLDTVELESHPHIVDPFDDSDDAISDFCRQS